MFVFVQWKSGVVKHLGWTVCDDLLCIQEDGTVLIYDLFGSFKRHFSMGNVRRSDTCTARLTRVRVSGSVFKVLFFKG